MLSYYSEFLFFLKKYVFSSVISKCKSWFDLLVVDYGFEASSLVLQMLPTFLELDMTIFGWMGGAWWDILTENWFGKKKSSPLFTLFHHHKHSFVKRILWFHTQMVKHSLEQWSLAWQLSSWAVKCTRWNRPLLAIKKVEHLEDTAW